MADNLIVSDEFISEAATYFSKQGMLLEDMLDRYVYIMTHAYTSSITSGSVHSGLAEYVGIAKTLNGELKALSEQIALSLQNFIIDVEEEDRYIY